MELNTIGMFSQDAVNLRSDRFGFYALTSAFLEAICVLRNDNDRHACVLVQAQAGKESYEDHPPSHPPEGARYWLAIDSLDFDIHCCSANQYCQESLFRLRIMHPLCHPAHHSFSETKFTQTMSARRAHTKNSRYVALFALL